MKTAVTTATIQEMLFHKRLSLLCPFEHIHMEFACYKFFIIIIISTITITITTTITITIIITSIIIIVSITKCLNLIGS